MQKIELLSPAGTFRNMQFALAYGADAVYAGQPRYSLRVRNNDFKRLETLADAIRYAHQQGKQFFLASNISPHNDKVKTYMRDLEPVIAIGPDALIMSDPGLIMMVRERWPEMPIHLSVQANAVNYATVRFWQKMGLTRIILSRELSLEEVAEIRQLCPDIELEVFVHGSLCIAYSGRCLLSGLHKPPRFQPGRVHQFVSVEIPGPRGQTDGQRRRRGSARTRTARGSDLSVTGTGSGPRNSCQPTRMSMALTS